MITNTFTLYCIYILVGIYGLCVGSFLNVVIYRLPLKISLSADRSFCPKCKSKIYWYDNVPLFSYVFLRGRCRNCKCRISPRYPLVEAANMIGWLGAFFIFKDNFIYAGIASLVFSIGICVFFIDIDHMIIPDRFNIMLAILGVVSIFFYPDTVWYSHLIGAVGGVAIFLLIGFIVGRAVGAEALGMGDVKLVGAMGLLLGWEKLILLSLIASVSASILLLIMSKKNGSEKNHEFPFAPFLIIGFFISLFFGNQIIGWYINLLV